MVRSWPFRAWPFGCVENPRNWSQDQVEDLGNPKTQDISGKYGKSEDCIKGLGLLGNPGSQVVGYPGGQETKVAAVMIVGVSIAAS